MQDCDQWDIRLSTNEWVRTSPVRGWKGEGAVSVRLKPRLIDVLRRSGLEEKHAGFGLAGGQSSGDGRASRSGWDCQRLCRLSCIPNIPPTITKSKIVSSIVESGLKSGLKRK
jgi:hypothetical protein